jgi:hypothetical protein
MLIHCLGDHTIDRPMRTLNRILPWRVRVSSQPYCPQLMVQLLLQIENKFTAIITTMNWVKSMAQENSN